MVQSGTCLDLATADMMTAVEQIWGGVRWPRDPVLISLATSNFEQILNFYPSNPLAAAAAPNEFM